MLAAWIGDRNAGLVLNQDSDDLRFRKATALQALVLFAGQNELQLGLSSRGKVKPHHLLLFVTSPQIRLAWSQPYFTRFTRYPFWVLLLTRCREQMSGHHFLDGLGYAARSRTCLPGPAFLRKTRPLDRDGERAITTAVAGTCNHVCPNFADPFDFDDFR